jgi:ABC-2 type transport system permease protein
VIARVSLSNALAYRIAIFSRFGFYTLFIFVFFSLWGAIYQEGSVQGYSYAQIVWYLIMTELITFSSGSGIYRQINDDVKSGAIAYLIGRPAHYVIYQFANALGQMILNLVCFGAFVSLLGIVLVGPLPTFRIEGIISMSVSLALGLILNYFILMLIGLASFVIEDNFGLYLIYQKTCFMLGMFLPVEFLPSWLQPIAKNMPFSYVYWAPARIFVDYSPEICWELIPRQAAWAAGAIVLVLFSYAMSVRRLQVNGG